MASSPWNFAMDHAALGRVQGEAHIREIQTLFTCASRSGRRAHVQPDARGRGCSARPSNGSRISARACGSVGGSHTPGNNGTQKGPSTTWDRNGAKWIKRALGKHLANVRFAGTSGSQARCEGAQAPPHWTEWRCRQRPSDELGRTCPTLLGCRRISGERQWRRRCRQAAQRRQASLW